MHSFIKTQLIIFYVKQREFMAPEDDSQNQLSTER